MEFGILGFGVWTVEFWGLFGIWEFDLRFYLGFSFEFVLLLLLFSWRSVSVCQTPLEPYCPYPDSKLRSKIEKSASHHDYCRRAYRLNLNA